ncbi:RTTN_N domain-containing protein [Haematococcus lacustris]|uniref:RTTN_N domain-containing protein n=1 Tax=Haematococcus lacustris TaxID=44745 RepID=A0A699Z0F2_HAELA|nr:RTTN_N domain-containing protein [Haematococcus lacustris]
MPPDWSRAALPVLARLRPDVAQVLAAAGQAQAALAAARQLQADLPHLGLAYVCSSSSLAGEVLSSQAEGAVLGLLTHPLQPVRLAVFSLLEGLIRRGVEQTAGNGPPAHQLLSGLLVRPAVLQHLLAVGLVSPGLASPVARMLQEVLQRGEPAVLRALAHWTHWIVACEGDPQVGVLAASLKALATRNASDLPDDAWDKAVAAVRGLFARRPEDRQQAAGVLRDVLYATVGLHMPASEPHASDPLKAVLDDGARDDFILPRATAAAANPAAAAGRLSRSFRVQDADNLLTILSNPALATELRR